MSTLFALTNNFSALELQNVKVLQEWLTNNEEIHNSCDKLILLKYLKSTNQDVERSKRKIIKLLCLKHELKKEIFDSFSPKLLNINDIIENDILLGYVAKLTEEGYRVVGASLPTPDASVIDVNRQLKFCALATVLRMHLDLNSKGDILIYDCKNLTVSHLTLLWQPLNRKIFRASLGAFPFVLHRVHLVHFPRTLWTFASFFLTESLKNKVVLHDDAEELLEYLPKECIPNDYGGCGGFLKQLTLEVYRETLKFEKVFEKFSLFELSS